MAQHKQRLGVLAAATIGIVVLVLVSSSLNQPSLKEILPTAQLRIGIDGSNPPFATTTSDGFSGLEIDLSKAIGENLGLPIQFIDLGYDGLYDALAADRVDVLIAAVPIDLQRSGAVTYSLPYFNAGLVLVSTENLQRMSDLPGKRLAVEYGSVSHSIAMEWLRRVAAYTLDFRDSAADSLEAVRLKDGDAALTDAVSAMLYLKDHQSWKAHLSPVTDNLFAAATRRDRPVVSRYIDDTVERLLADGSISGMIAKWL